MNSQEKIDLIKNFNEFKKDEKNPYAIAAMKSLMEFARNDDSTTMQEFIAKMGEARKALQSSSPHVSVRSGCELFVRFITFSQQELEQPSDFRSCREILLKRGQNYTEQMLLCRSKILEISEDLIEDDVKILTHARSKNVFEVMKLAYEKGKRFQVFVSEAQPTCDGRRLVEELKGVGIKATVILDSSVSFFIEKRRIDVVIVGAEAICKDGGIINRIGTCNIAMLAHFKNIPIHVIAESFKFVRLMPINNNRLPKEFVYPVECVTSGKNLEDEQPLVDYTNPKFLTNLYTDLGIMNTATVVEHFINLYT